MLAAVIGGGIVLFGGDQIAKLGEQAGLQLPRPEVSIPPELSNRLAALETEVRATPAAQVPEAVAGRLSALEARIVEAEALSRRVPDLEAAQAELRANAGTASGDDPGVAQRLTQLERTLETLSNAAGPEGTSGDRLAQLTALSGKIADLEASLQTQLTALREGVFADVERRLAPAAEAGETARAGTQRLDRELAETKSEMARVTQRVEAISATTDRLDQAVRTAQSETGRLTDEVSAVRGDLAQQIARVAMPRDIQSAVTPLSEQVAALQQNLEQVLQKDADRQQNAARVVMSLQLANLKRAIDRGTGFTEELEAVRSAAGGSLDLKALEPFRVSGVPTLSQLSADFRSLSHDMISAAEAKPDGTWVDQMLAGAKSIVRVRRTGEQALEADPNSAEAIVARVENLLRQGDIAAAADAAKTLPPEAAATAKDWLTRLEARASIDRAIAAIEQDLKSALGGPAPSRS